MPAAADEASAPGMPPDVVALFAWANMKGVPYRDFSAARRAYRAEVRHRAAVTRRDAEATAKARADQAAADADRAARGAREAAQFHATKARQAGERLRGNDAAAEGVARERALAQAEQLSRQAAIERMEAARHAEAFRAAELAARYETWELAQARTQGIAAKDVHGEEFSNWGRDDRAGEHIGQPGVGDECPVVIEHDERGPQSTDGMLAERLPPRRAAHSLFALGEEAEAEVTLREERRWSGLANSAPELPPVLGAKDTAKIVEQYARVVQGSEPLEIAEPWSFQAAHDIGPSASPHDLAEETLAASRRGREPTSHARDRESGSEGAPAWFRGQEGARGMGTGRSPMRESLQHSREKVAARWFALRGLFDSSGAEAEPAESRAPDENAPLLAIFSVPGGVGKTSLAASLTRALAAQGERVLLVDTTQREVLPFYLGGRELRPDIVRTFAPPAGSTYQPIHLVSYGMPSESSPGESVATKVKRDGAGFSRVIVDVASAANGILRELIDAGAQVLVPLAPEMNSVISLPAVRRALESGSGGSGSKAEAAFLLVQFDPSQPLQLDVREVLQQQLGAQLLPFAVRRSPAIAEALAEGMTVIDYAPGEGIAKDYLQLAAWARAQTEPAREGLAQARWSER